MNTNYSNTQPAFTAGLVVKGIKLDSDKLNAVGKKFSAYTHHYKDDKLMITKELIKGYDGQGFYSLDFSNCKTSAGFVSDIADFKNWFAQTSTTDIAKSFSRVFKFAKLKEIKQATMLELHNNYRDSLGIANVNMTKFDSTKNPVFKVLAISSENRAKVLESDIKKHGLYYQSINDKITDNPISNLINWWEEF